MSPKKAKYLKILSNRNRRKTLPVLTEEINSTLGTTASHSTIRRCLKDMGLISRVACKKPLLRKGNVIKRLKFAREHLNWTKEQWGKILFTDKTKVEIFGLHRRAYVRRAAGERYLNECLVSTVKFGGGSIMCWGNICKKLVLQYHLSSSFYTLNQ